MQDQYPALLTDNMSFVHLHTHSHYSLLDGLPTIPKLVAAAKKNKMSSLALTDHGAMYGLIEFYQECREQKIKPILGVEGYLSDSAITEHNKERKPYHLVLLARSKTGYKNLLKLISIAHLEGYYYKPRFDWKTLEQYSEGLIALSGCLNGPLARPIVEKNPSKVDENLKLLMNIFGTEDLYLEIQYRPSLPQQSLVNSELKKIGHKHSLSLVATNDSHYIDIEDAQAHDVLICLQTKKKLADKDRMNLTGEDLSLKTEKAMIELFKDTPDAISNTQVIADRCDVEIDLEKINLPHYEIPDKQPSETYLQTLCEKGVIKRYGVSYDEAPEDLKHRLAYELDIIKKTGFSDYFLIVQDIVNWARNHDVMVGPGRGSAAGSIVSYLIGITNIDPLQYELLFERFLNPERISMPDIDMDFADAGRDKVLNYIEQKYGQDRVAQIITFGTMAARAAIRDVGRVLDLSYNYCDRIAKMIPMFTKLSVALEKVDELKTMYNNEEDAKKLIDLAKKVEGVARHASTHACAVLITKEPLTNHVPLQYSSSDNESIISQYSMYPAEKLGLLKIDVLGLKNLTILQTAVDIIEATTGTVINLDTMPLVDKKTFQLLQRGETVGIFQLESSGMTRHLKTLRPTDMEDIIAMISLYRPGPMQFIDDYIAGKHGKKKAQYLHPKLVNILSKTYGIAIYQEQVLQIARDLAGFTYGEADELRRAVGKKIKKALLAQSEKMIHGMIENGIEKRTAEKIWEFILPFARYGFNRSHAASYAMIAYQTAYLKSHYPAQFMAALMTADQGDTDAVAKDIVAAERMGLRIQAPDVNESYSTFAVIRDRKKNMVTNKIRFGLRAIKNVGLHIAETIVSERKINGTFTSLEDFLLRINDKDLNKKSLESLIKCGALDSLGNRNILLGNLEQLLLFNKKAQKRGKTGQEDLFADLPLAARYLKVTLKEVPEIPQINFLNYEKELLGLYISDHPFKEYLPLLEGKIIKLAQISAVKSQDMVKVGGIITSIHKITTRAGKPMLFVTLDDSTSTLEVIVFPKLLEATAHAWTDNALILVSGKISDKDGAPKILAETLEPITEDLLSNIRDKKNYGKKIWLTLPKTFTKDQMHSLKKVCEQSPGTMSVYMIINNGRTRKIRTNLKISFPQETRHMISEIIGSKNILMT